MRVVIATPESDSLAHRALAQEDYPHEEIKVDDADTYGQLLSTLWDDGEPFTLIEHDIVPWPGSVQYLERCGHPWCTYKFPVYPNNLVNSMGIFKVAPRGPALREWSYTRWQDLEHKVMPFLRQLFGEEHIHEPPVAHPRQELVRAY